MNFIVFKLTLGSPDWDVNLSDRYALFNGFYFGQGAKKPLNNWSWLLKLTKNPFFPLHPQSKQAQTIIPTRFIAGVVITLILTAYLAGHL